MVVSCIFATGFVSHASVLRRCIVSYTFKVVSWEDVVLVFGLCCCQERRGISQSTWDVNIPLASSFDRTLSLFSRFINRSP